jgi:SagB-type dehydrogenase family enzyme
MGVDGADRSRRGVVTSLLGLGMLAAPGGSLRAQAVGLPLRLPEASTGGPLDLEAALQRRRSVRRFARMPLALADTAQLLWAAQGITDARGHRTAPSAGALYPLELVVVAGQVDGLAAGSYRHLAAEQALLRIADGDARAAVAAATRGQPWVAEAPLILVLAADPARTAARYGERAERFIALEAGAVAQNVYLQCAARGWATTLVGAFDEVRLRQALGLGGERNLLALMPVGKAA